MNRRNRRFTFTVRSLLVFVAFIAVIAWWAGAAARRVESRRRLESDLQEAGAYVYYYHEFDAGIYQADATPPGPAILRTWFGEDAFVEIRGIVFDELAAVEHTNEEISRSLSLVECAAELEWLVLPRGNDATLRQVGRARSLKSLDLTNSGITDEGLGELRRLSHMRELALVNTSITGRGLADLAELKDLRSLDVTGTRMSDELFGVVSHWPFLERLSASHTLLSDVGLECIAACSELRHLKVANTGVTDAGMESIAALRELESVDLSGTAITNRGFEALKTLRNLRTVDVTSTQVTTSGIVAFRVANPECEVVQGGHAR